MCHPKQCMGCAGILLLCCLVDLSTASANFELKQAHQEASVPHRHVHGSRRALAKSVSVQDCKHVQLPLHLTSATTAAEPADYLFTAASGFTPYITRPLLRTFRQHNQAARVLVFLDGAQVRICPVFYRRTFDS